MRMGLSLKWTAGQWLTFLAFYTPAGWVAMGIAGLAMWATLPVWVALTLAVLAVDKARAPRS